MKILLLMAGGSEPYAEAGFYYPKNLAEIGGEPLVQHVVRSLGTLSDTADVVAVVQKHEDDRFHTAQVIRLLVPGASIVTVDGPTGGAACTALLAVEHIADDEPLLVLNGDQILDTDLSSVVAAFEQRELDGGIVVFEGVHPRWSYVKCNSDGLVVEAAEKRPISKLATAGTYWFRRGCDFVEATMAMIKKDAHVDGRFYVCPAYNEMVLRQRRIGVYSIDRSDYFPLNDPQGIPAFEARLQEMAKR